MNKIFIISYCIILICDFFIKKGYLGKTIKDKYLSFSSKSYFTIFSILFFISLTILMVLGFFDITIPFFF